MLADDGNGLCGRNVVTGLPIVIPRRSVEILLDDLLSPRQSVASALREIMADRIAEPTKRVRTSKETAIGEG